MQWNKSLIFNKTGPLLKIQWNADADSIWSIACDFPGTHFESVKTKSKECGHTCALSPLCTHYAWTDLADFDGGTCWMKSGLVEKKDANSNDNHGMRCGLLAESNILAILTMSIYRFIDELFWSKYYAFQTILFCDKTKRHLTASFYIFWLSEPYRLGLGPKMCWKPLNFSS